MTAYPLTRLATDELPALDELSLPIVEERAFVGKTVVEGDRVRVGTHTETVEEWVRETLETNEVRVRRVPVNRTIEPGETAPAIRSEGGTTIVPVLEEILVVEKRLVLKEELHIVREMTTDEFEVPITLRKQRVVVERTGPDGQPKANSEESAS